MAGENPTISFVIPCHNEAGNLRALVTAIHASVQSLSATYEIIVTDDFSSDNSWTVLKELAAGDRARARATVRVNCGQSAALWAGMKAARGKYIVTLDADLQNDPQRCAKIAGGAGRNLIASCGTRVEARGHGDNFVRIVSSRIANWVRNKLSGENITDAGCCYRAFKRECIDESEIFQGDAPFPADAVQN